MRIEGIVISCYKGDLELTRICTASIRYWHPEVPIWLLKDLKYGDFYTGDLEKYFGVQIYPTKNRAQGWGFGKLETMTELPARRLLLIDSDIVFIGRLLERLEKFDEDLVVESNNYSSSDIETLYYVHSELAKLDQSFIPPGWGFNGGQILATTGSLTKEDFEGFVDWKSRTVTHPRIFQMGDQGLLNYIAQRKIAGGQLTLHREDFMIWPGTESATAQIKLEDLIQGKSFPALIHWAGLRWGKKISEMPRADILLFFEDLYYKTIPLGSCRRTIRKSLPRIMDQILMPIRSLKKWIKGT